MPKIIINGPEGRIEARYHRSKIANAPLALVLHPHPKYGGTMDNKVTYALYHCFTQQGFSAVRFNFRGVGCSEGTFDQGEGELADSAAVLDWLQEQNFNASTYWVGGFSFGAWIGMQLLMRRPELRGFIAVSPPANVYDFSFLAPCPVSGQIVHGEKDEIVSKESVDSLVEKLNSQKGISIDYCNIEAANHFFAGRINELMENVNAYIKANACQDSWAANT